ncbi:hypothetical protein [Streptomyces sp. NBC_00624]|uniref:hypothetical protein n=1 Tax=Streptomyces sp. NBC_00624 TaxID=2975791 RepID=UPI00386E5AB5
MGVAAASADLDPATRVGRMVARILVAVARAEAEAKGARQKPANAAHAAEGDVHFGGVRPSAFENGRVTVVPEGAEAMRRLWWMCSRQGKRPSPSSRMTGTSQPGCRGGWSRGADGS